MNSFRNKFSSVSLVLCAVTIAAGCGRGGPAPASQAAAKAAENKYGLHGCLYIVLDAFDAGHASHLGYPRATTPVIDALAKRGVSFSHVYSQCPNTLGSTQSFMSGRYLPAPLGGDLPYALDPHTPLMAEAFKGAGYRTAAFSENPYIRENTGFARGFDTFRGYDILLPKVPGHPSRKRDESITPRVFNEAEQWILQQDKNDWFCYMHLLRPHDPYSAPDPYGKRFLRDPALAEPERDVDIMFRTHWKKYAPTPDEIQFVTDLYDGSLAYIDSLVGAFLDRLGNAGMLRDAIVIVTSDHGEAFMQHGSFKHGDTVYDEMIHVPLVVVAPPNVGWPVGPRNQTLELVDVFPTLADVFALRAPGGMEGKSFVDALETPRAKADGTTYSQTTNGDRVAYRRGNEKIIFAKQDGQFQPTEVYDLAADPGEKNNLVVTGTPPADLVASGLAAIQKHYRAPETAAGKLTPEQSESLKSLGYVKE